MQLIQHNVMPWFVLWSIAGGILTALLYGIFPRDNKLGELFFKIGIAIGGPSVWIVFWFSRITGHNPPQPPTSTDE